MERDEQFQLSFTYSGSQPGVIVRPGFDQANITIRNDDGMYICFLLFIRDMHSLHVCRVLLAN